MMTMCGMIFQVSTLRNEIDEKQAQIEEHRDTLQKLTLAHEQLQRDFERLKEDEHEKSKRLQELLSLNERREPAVIVAAKSSRGGWMK